ncbi:MAG: RNA 2'-phosphotransferase [Candidatus Thorarchaeota archaeon]|jgi:putative RNA 2'-phosphotransferase
MDYKKLSKTLSRALRHKPDSLGIKLDAEGWVSVEDLLKPLRKRREEWKDLQQDDLEEMNRAASKQRFEIQDGKMRAIYGHSVAKEISRVASTPPEILYHGTSPATVSAIKEDGLKPMNRQNVHLSRDKATALEVGRRKAKTPSLLKVKALLAHKSGISFYEGNDKIWLSHEIPPRFIEFD